MDKQLPIYELLISEQENSELEVSAVAFVDAPAIERNFMCFKKVAFGGPGSGPNPGDSDGGETPDIGSMSDSELNDYKQKCIDKAEELVKKKKKLYSNPDIESAMSPEEKSLTKEIAKQWGDADSVIREKRKRKAASDVKMVSNDIEIESLKFAAIDDVNYEVFGPAMIPDMPIFRSDETGDYNVVFSKETVRQCSQMFFQKNYQSMVNIGHDPKQSQDGVTFFQSHINDPRTFMIPGYAEGTWFLGANLKNNKPLWEKTKSGELRGYSVEGMFSYIKKKKTPEQIFEEIKQLLSAVE